MALTAGAASADTVFTVANTFQDPQMTGGNEISTIAFNADVYANQAANVSTAIELPNFVNFYEIDVAYDRQKTNHDQVKEAVEAQLAPLKEAYPQYSISVKPPEAEEEAQRWMTKVMG